MGHLCGGFEVPLGVWESPLPQLRNGAVMPCGSQDIVQRLPLRDVVMNIIRDDQWEPARPRQLLQGGQLPLIVGAQMQFSKQVGPIAEGFAISGQFIGGT